MASSYLIAAARTPLGKLLGGLASLTAPELASQAIRAVLERAGVAPSDVEEVILGNVVQAGVGQAPARQAALGAGLPPSVAAVTVNKVCGSGLKAVMLADQAIRAGDARCIVAGGMESMSRAPHLLTGTRAGWKFGEQRVLDALIHDGLWCSFEQCSMGAEADDTAVRCGVSRAAQDAFSVESHRRAIAASAAGAFQAEIVPVTIANKRGSVTVASDEGPRGDTTLESLARLPVSFEDRFGVPRSVTAGNASQLSDGAAALLVVDEERARRATGGVRARIVAHATAGVPPRELFTAPVAAIEQVLHKARLTLDAIDLVELNEAFAAQVLACAGPLGLDLAKTNVHGGAIALGHPIGASGARVLVTLLHALEQRGLQRGLASLCLGGGNAVALIVERCG